MSDTPFQGFGDHDVEPAHPGVLEESLITGTERGGAADGVIGVGLRERPVFRINPLAAEPHLILDEGVTLIVR